jgi:small-conductance mechanosensitive channel/CRP-like cAMP-binding protein
MVVVLLLALPRGRRSLLRGPLLCMALVPALDLSRLLFPDDAAVRAFLQATALFFLLVGLARCAFLLVVDVVLDRLGPPASKIVRDSVQIGIYGFLFVVVLRQAGVDMGTLFTGSALLTAALGLSLRDTLGNLVAGLALQAERPFQIGDWIQYDANAYHVGRVVEINWRATKVITLDDAEVILPNGQLALAYIRNFTRPEPHSRRSVYVVAPYGVPPEQVRQVILAAVGDAWGVLPTPPPSVVTNAFTDRGVEYWLRFWTKEFGARDRVDGGVRDRIWYAFDRAGIRIPVARTDIRVDRTPPASPAGEAVAAREALLRQADLFAVLPESAVRLLAASARAEQYVDGECIIRQGETGESLYLIEAGRVSVLARPTGGGDPVLVARLGPGEFFGEMSLLTGETRSATVRACGSARVLAVDKPAFAAVLEADPALADALGEVLTRRRAVLTATLASAPQTTPEPQADLLDRIYAFFGLPTRSQTP